MRLTSVNIKSAPIIVLAFVILAFSDVRAQPISFQVPYTWDDINLSASTEKMQEEVGTLRAFITKIGWPSNMDAIRERVRNEDRALQSRLLSATDETNLIRVAFQTPTASQAERDAATQKLNANLNIMKQRLVLLDHAYAAQTAVTMLSSLDARLSDRTSGPPAIQGKSYPAVKGHWGELIKILLRGG